MTSNELPLKATLKAGAGYDAPWLTVDAATPDDLEFKLNALAEGNALSALVNAAEALKAINTLAPVGATPVQEQAPAQPAGWGNSAPQAQPAWSQAPAQPVQQAAPAAPQGVRTHPEGKACHCGNVLQFKDVFSKAKQKSFQFWECPLRTGKDSPHISEFAN